MTRIIEKINARRKQRAQLRLNTQQITNHTNKVDDDHNDENNTSNQTKNDDNNNNNKNSSSESSSSIELPASWYYSFEFFPPKTEAGLDNLLTRIDRMSNHYRMDPLFIDVTWGDSGSTSVRSMAVASHAQRYCGVDVLLHLTCTGVTREQLAAVLRQAKSYEIRNILALRGDPPRGKRCWEVNDVSGGECDYAIDLVKLVRSLHGSYFGIACAGHPEGHPASGGDWDVEMGHLREKVEAGADFIITQFFYDADLFLAYVKRCRVHGIMCPILPGLMPIQSYSSFMRMTKFCNITVPAEVQARLEPVKDDDEAVKQIGCEIAVEMAWKILTTPVEEGGVDGIHFYTLNLERSVTRILMSMGAIPDDVSGDNTNTTSASSDERGGTSGKDNKERKMQSTAGVSNSSSLLPNSRRQLPWKPSAMESRLKEDVRPINWANRPKSYVMRTEDWDEFPNGRWGDSTSPAFGELSDLSHFYSFTLGSEDDRRAMLGHNPTNAQDIYEVFAQYCEGKIPHLPWCENPLQPESSTIQKELASLNRAGFLTINSQPNVNGASSSHPTYGWGGAGGYVYQKAYCECFVSPVNAQSLVSMVSQHPNLNLYAVNNAGQELRVGIEEGGATALTWGVFPNREILQPTIFDPSTFFHWAAEEAFSLWTSMWLSLYEFDSASYEVVESIRDTYYLVAIIDNDFVSNKEGGRLWDKLLGAGNISAK